MVVFVLENVISKISDFCKIIIEQLKRIQLNRLRKSVGAILIEFAFALPVFLVLLYYIHDLPRLRLMQRKMQFMSYEMAAIIQNIAQQKSMTSNPLITEKDLSNALSLAGLSWFAGNTFMPIAKNTMPFGYALYLTLHYVNGKSSNSLERKWNKVVLIRDVTPFYSSNNDDDTAIVITDYKDRISIGSGEKKIFVELFLLYDYKGQWGWKFSNGTSTGSITPRKAFGFLFFTPNGQGINTRAFFPAVTIFTPRVGSFSETEPPK